jgi:single-strand DNA-binding protein
MSLNKCMIIGNLGGDPEMRYTAGGKPVTQLRVAVNHSYRGQNNEWQKETEWFRVVVWGDAAERAAERLRKGSKVYIEGRLQTREWQDREGQKRFTTELVAQTVTPLDPRAREDEGGFQGGFPGRAPGAPGDDATDDGSGRAPRREPAGPPAENDYADLDELPF